MSGLIILPSDEGGHRGDARKLTFSRREFERHMRKENMNQRSRKSSSQRIKKKSLLNFQYDQGNTCIEGKQKSVIAGTVHLFYFLASVHKYST